MAKIDQVFPNWLNGHTFKGVYPSINGADDPDATFYFNKDGHILQNNMSFAFPAKVDLNIISHSSINSINYFRFDSTATYPNDEKHQDDSHFEGTIWENDDTHEISLEEFLLDKNDNVEQVYYADLILM